MKKSKNTSSAQLCATIPCERPYRKLLTVPPTRSMAGMTGRKASSEPARSPAVSAREHFTMEH